MWPKEPCLHPKAQVSSYLNLPPHVGSTTKTWRPGKQIPRIFPCSHTLCENWVRIMPCSVNRIDESTPVLSSDFILSSHNLSQMYGKVTVSEGALMTAILNGHLKFITLTERRL